MKIKTKDLASTVPIIRATFGMMDFYEALELLDLEGTPYQFVRHGNLYNTMCLQLQIDGRDTGCEIRLNSDGTYSIEATVPILRLY